MQVSVESGEGLERRMRVELPAEQIDAEVEKRLKKIARSVKLDGFDPTRVKVTSSLGNVYLMGLLTPREADAVTEEVRFVSGVKRVVKLFEYL